MEPDSQGPPTPERTRHPEDPSPRVPEASRARDNAIIRCWDRIGIHVWGPLGSVLFHVIVLTILLNFAVERPSATGGDFNVVIMEPRVMKLDDVDKRVEDEIRKVDEVRPQPPDPVNSDAGVADAASLVQDTGGSGGADTGPGIGSGDTSLPLGFEFSSAAKSPLVMKGLYANRTAAGRKGALGKYGGSGAGEDAVLRALRWLKKCQREDGSWNGESGGEGRPPEPAGEHYGFTGVSSAMTGLALLTFLAHGETPASQEFGPTVEKAILHLLESQAESGFFAHADGNDLGYTHSIVTYALCEAYALTKVPAIKDTAEKGIDYIIAGQNKTRGWNYDCRGERTDVSVTAWCCQALKAAKMAGLQNSELEGSITAAVECLRKALFWPEHGTFTYTPNDRTLEGLTCAGVLSLQLLGAANADETKRGLAWLEQNASCDWRNPWGRSPLYYWYYTTQAKFHAGGETWRKWNAQFARALVENQTVLKGAGVDGRDIGFWKAVSPQEYCVNYVYNTTLCTLQLEVYYRYLPTYQPTEPVNTAEVDSDEGAVKVKVQ